MKFSREITNVTAQAGKIAQCNDNLKTKVGKMIANFIVLCLRDNTFRPHWDSLRKYDEHADNAPNHTWIMINHHDNPFPQPNQGVVRAQ